MLRLSAGLFLVLHGLIHLGYAAPNSDDPRYPFSPERAWIATAGHLEATRAKGIFSALGVLTAAVFAVAGIALWFDLGAWQPLAVIAAVGSLLTLVLAFHPWLTLGVAIDVGILAAVAAGWPAALYS